MNSDLLKKTEDFIKKTQMRAFVVGNHSYYAHALRTRELLDVLNISDEDLHVLALLHHSFEFNSPKEINSIFGKKLGDLITLYTKISSAKYIKNYNNNDELIKSLFAFISSIDDAKLIFLHLADRLALTENLFLMKKEKRLIIAQENLAFYAPLARILNMSEFVRLLEDNSFKVLDSKSYYSINKKIKMLKRRFYEKTYDFEKFLHILISEHLNVPDFKVDYRVKGIYSLHKKHLRKGKENDIKNVIYDTFAFRIVVPTIKDCYHIETLLNSTLNFLSSERDDYIKNPKPSGYKSIHQVYEVSSNFFVEVQIKTFAMHEFNEYGYASHTAYKFKSSINHLLDKKPSFLKELDYKNMPDSKASTFDDYVYVFTPKGDLKRLKKGSTPIDFAYLIHSKVGDRCIGAYINESLVPLNYQLQSGDTVKIKLAKLYKKPSLDWLDFVAEKRSKHLITKALRR